MNVYLNGEVSSIENAKISPMDRGFLFGDGVYEVIPVFNRKPFTLTSHLQRLNRSLEAIQLPNPHTEEEWCKLISERVADADIDDIALYLQVTRGTYEKRDHVFPSEITPTVFIAPLIMNKPTAKAIEQGVSVVSAVDNRWGNGHIKATSLLANVLLRSVSAKASAVETILFRDEFLTEASASNIFVVKDGVLLIVPNNNFILSGITYDIIRALAKKKDMPHEMRKISREEVFAADELWVSSSTKMILAVTKLDGKPVGNGIPGDMFKQMHDWIWAYQRSEITI